MHAYSMVCPHFVLSGKGRNMVCFNFPVPTCKCASLPQGSSFGGIPNTSVGLGAFPLFSRKQSKSHLQLDFLLHLDSHCLPSCRIRSGECWFLCGFYGGVFAFVLLLSFVFVADPMQNLLWAKHWYYIRIHLLCPHEKEKSYGSSHFHIRKLKHKNTSNLPRIPMGLEVKPSQAGPRGYALNPALNCLFQRSSIQSCSVSAPHPQVALQPLQVISGSQTRLFSHARFSSAVLLFSSGHSSGPSAKITRSAAFMASLQLHTRPH